MMLKVFQNLEITDQLDAKGAGLGDYSFRFQFLQQPDMHIQAVKN